MSLDRCTWIRDWIVAWWTIFTLATLDDLMQTTTVLKDNESSMMEWRRRRTVEMNMLQRC